MGTWAAVVPLAANLAPFFARIAQVSLNDVDGGLIEAARAMGCKRWHIVRHVLLPEALPGIIGGMTVSVIAMVNARRQWPAPWARAGWATWRSATATSATTRSVMFEVIVILIAAGVGDTACGGVAGTQGRSPALKAWPCPVCAYACAFFFAGRACIETNNFRSCQSTVP
jgi:ABC-type nitrate/sulfonate/bicarbonate transport system permease component